MSSQNEDIPYFLFIVLLQCLFLNQVFCNLHRIQCSPFFDLVTYNPECQSVLIAEVLTDTTNVNRVLPARNNGMGYSFSAGLSIRTKPSPLANASRASSVEMGRSVSTQMLSEWERRAGTRTQVALTLRQSA